MGIVERYARATRSSNLKCDESHFDTESLAAVALCGVPLGPLLLRAKYSTTEGNPAAMYDLRRAWIDVVAKAALIGGWPEKVKVSKVVAASIEYWMNDACPACTGRKSDQVNGTPCLSGVECATCSGTGKRKIPADAQHAPYVEKMINTLNATALSARIGASAKSRESETC